METAEAVYDAVSSWRAMFYDGVGGDTITWQRTHRRAWEITQKWMKLRDDDL